MRESLVDFSTLDEIVDECGVSKTDVQQYIILIALDANLSHDIRKHGRYDVLVPCAVLGPGFTRALADILTCLI